MAAMVKKQGGATYVFAVAMKPGDTEAAFTLDSLPASAQVEVLGEHRKIVPVNGRFIDHFSSWDVHLYRIQLRRERNGRAAILTAAALCWPRQWPPARTKPIPAFSPYAQWKNGPPKDDSCLPIAVWYAGAEACAHVPEGGLQFLQGLWMGPTEAQLAELKKQGMPVICDQNAVGLAHKDDPLILGWRRGRTGQLPGAPGAAATGRL